MNFKTSIVESYLLILHIFKFNFYFSLKNNVCLSLPIRIEYFGGRLRYVSLDGGVRGWRHVAHAGRAVGTIVGGRRCDGGGAGDGCYAAGEPVLGFRQGQILVSDAARRRVAISSSVKTVSSGGGLKSVVTVSGREITVLAELMIALATDRVAIVATLN